jgi:hypothetical protein
LEGRDAFAEFLHEGEGAVVHLRQSDAGWRLEGAYGPSNRGPTLDLRETLYRHLHAHGVQGCENPQPHRTAWQSLHRLVQTSVLDFDED